MQTVASHFIPESPNEPDWSLADLPYRNFPAEDFVRDLEHVIIHEKLSWFKIRRWAKEKYQLENILILKSLTEKVRLSWMREESFWGSARVRRYVLRLKYEALFDKCMEESDHVTALKVLESLARVDNVYVPDMNLTQINVAGQPISAKSRERVQELLEEMRRRSEDNESLAVESRSHLGNGHGFSSGDDDQ
jgi:hypothetical protein